jgi:hypothetical protein
LSNIRERVNEEKCENEDAPLGGAGVDTNAETEGVTSSGDQLLVEGTVGGDGASPVLRTLNVHPDHAEAGVVRTEELNHGTDLTGGVSATRASYI